MMIKEQDTVIKGRKHLILLEHYRNKQHVSEAQTRQEDPVASCWAAGTRRTHWVLTPGLSSWFKEGGEPIGQGGSGLVSP